MEKDIVMFYACFPQGCVHKLIVQESPQLTVCKRLALAVHAKVFIVIDTMLSQAKA